MKRNKPIATAFKLSLNLDRIKDEKMREKVEFDIRQTEHFGVLYLAKSCPEIKVIEDMGYRFIQKGEYYVFPRFISNL